MSQITVVTDDVAMHTCDGCRNCHARTTVKLSTKSFRLCSTCLPILRDQLTRHTAALSWGVDQGDERD